MPKQPSSSLRALTVEDIFATNDIEETVIPIPEWNGTVTIRTFSRRQVADITKQSTTRDRYTGKDVTDQAKLEALTFIEGVVSPKFTLDDYERLLDKSIAPLLRIIKAINLASGLSEESVQDAVKSTENGRDAEV
jgi:hypothetical protein